MLHLIYHWVIIFRSLLRSRDSSLTILDVKKQSQFEKTVLLAPIWTGAALPLSRCRACGRSGSAVFLLISTASTVALKSQSLLQQSLSTEKGKWTKTSRCNPRIHTQAHNYLPQLLKASERLKLGSFCLGESPLLLQHPVSLCTQLSWTHMCRVIVRVLTCVTNTNKA